jgi:hypothetical protein
MLQYTAVKSEYQHTTVNNTPEVFDLVNSLQDCPSASFMRLELRGGVEQEVWCMKVESNSIMSAHAWHFFDRLNTWIDGSNPTQGMHLLALYEIVLSCVGSVTASVVKWSEFLATDPEVLVRFPALPEFLTNIGSGTGSTQPREYNWGATWKKK